MTSGAEDCSYTAHVITDRQPDSQKDRYTSSHLRYNVELAATLPTVVGTRDDCIDPTSLCLYC